LVGRRGTRCSLRSRRRHVRGRRDGRTRRRRDLRSSDHRAQLRAHDVVFGCESPRHHIAHTARSTRMTTAVAQSQPPTEPAVDAKRRARRVTLLIVSRYGTLIGLALMIIAFTIRAPTTFLTLPNFLNILNQSSLTAIIAAGLTMALVVGEFDLSIGY